jgi:hypothetical protein
MSCERPVSVQLADLRRSEGAHRALEHIATAGFIPFLCSPNCSETTISWVFVVSTTRGITASSLSSTTTTNNTEPSFELSITQILVDPPLGANIPH